ncbi:hypothetical protein NBRC116583_09280 [Arenicella sp. 4NH20-0111]|uniref:lytic murein transglycosylase B n=1 Tax=Arenicella sp. 4NH20-0111 TaxID=3127648 RepID=UPI003108A002
MKYNCVLGSLVLLIGFSVASVHAIELSDHPKVQEVADRLVADGHYTSSELEELFRHATVQKNVLDAMTNPAEYKFTWGKYRKLFLKSDRIQRGVEFWKANKETLTRAEKDYGVPASVIVAIIGVESKFGKFKGKYKVLDSLVTLVTGFPRRSKFFASELEHFLILCKENGLDAKQILGSYAGAVGYPQFISSSYRNYAIDFNDDGSTDLINQVDDAIGSIANYFIENGWKPGEPVTSVPVTAVTNEVASLVSRKRKVQYTAADLRSKGAIIDTDIPEAEKMGVLMLDASEVVHDKKSSDTYIVRAGDTACEIAERNNVSCRKLITLNKLGKQGKIFRGQRLKLPVKAQLASQRVRKGSKDRSSSQNTKWEVVRSPVADKVSETEDRTQPRYFYTHHNFYAITQYNHSVLYAMAVYDLSSAINDEYQKL